MKENQRLFAFWSYSSFGYSTVLGGEISRINKDGRIKCDKYPCMLFKPVAILPYEEGVKIFEEIKQDEQLMNEEREQRIAQHNALITSKLNLK